MASTTISAPVRRTRVAAGAGPMTSTRSRGARTSPASRVATRAPRVTPRVTPRESARAAPRPLQRPTHSTTSGSVVSPVRLTRRGRYAAFAASLAGLVMVVVGSGQMAGASNDAGSAEPSSVVVQAGETLWGIAQAAAPGHDPRLVISQIRDLNDLGTRSIVPGQTLIVPTLG